MLSALRFNKRQPKRIIRFYNELIANNYFITTSTVKFWYCEWPKQTLKYIHFWVLLLWICEILLLLFSDMPIFTWDRLVIHSAKYNLSFSSHLPTIQNSLNMCTRYTGNKFWLFYLFINQCPTPLTQSRWISQNLYGHP